MKKICFAAAFLTLVLTAICATEQPEQQIHPQSANFIYHEQEPVSQGQGSPQSEEAWQLKIVSRLHPLARPSAVALQEVGDIQFDRRAAAHLTAFLAAAQGEGVELVLISGYRSFEHSQRILADKVRELISSGYAQDKAEAEAVRWVAPPGESEHHLGLAVDVVSKEYYSLYGRYLDTPFEAYREFNWLLENCAESSMVLSCAIPRARRKSPVFITSRGITDMLGKSTQKKLWSRV